MYRIFVVCEQVVGGIFSPRFGLFHIPLVDRDYFLQMRVALKLGVGAYGLDRTIFDHADAVRQVKEVDSMCHENACFVLEHALEDLFEYPLFHVGIEGGYRIVHQDYLFVRVNGPR